MLKTICFTDNKTTRGCAMLLGGFDGLHLGHRRLLARAQESGLPVGAMTIVGGKEDSLFTFAEREEIFRSLGVDFVFELLFEEIKAWSAEAFVVRLLSEFSPKYFVCGEDFRFGSGACGTPQTLKSMGQVRVDILPLVELEGEKVSSKRIKAYLKEGKVEKANEQLGDAFFLLGKVEKDRQVGRTIGFPTANVAYPSGKLPIKIGVYESRVAIDGQVYRGITNYGARPTFGDERVWTETHLDGFCGDLYGRTIKVEFTRFLREIEKFESADALCAQLQKDIRRVREND